MWKAAFFDIDGTLVGFGHKEVQPATLAALDRARSRGLRLFVASGRHRSIIRNLRDYPFDGYITMNGSHVELGGDVVFRLPIGRAEALRAAQICAAHGIPLLAFTEQILAISLENEVTARVENQIHVDRYPVVDMVKVAAEVPVYQYSVYLSEERFLPELRALPDILWQRWHPDMVDMNHRGATKAAAMEAVLRREGLRPEEVIAFGDGGNDVPMLRAAGVGVAMGNAPEDVRRQADYVTGAADGDGIEAALAHFGLI